MDLILQISSAFIKGPIKLHLNVHFRVYVNKEFSTSNVDLTRATDAHSPNTNNTEAEACCGMFVDLCHTPCIPMVGGNLHGTGLHLVNQENV